MVDHDTLHDAYARAGFVLYPTAFPGENYVHAGITKYARVVYRVDASVSALAFS